MKDLKKFHLDHRRLKKRNFSALFTLQSNRLSGVPLRTLEVRSTNSPLQQSDKSKEVRKTTFPSSLSRTSGHSTGEISKSIKYNNFFINQSSKLQRKEIGKSMDFLNNVNKIASEFPKGLKTPEKTIPYVEPSKISNKNLGVVDAFAANTNKGTVREANEDRVTILLNIIKPKNVVGDWPRCHIFGVFDGHGGHTCAEYLRHNLHNFILNEKDFANNTPEAILKGFKQAELNFQKRAQTESISSVQFDPSGSCALLAILLSGSKLGENILYIANLGDSRAILSSQKGKTVCALSVDHKPCDPSEFERITNAGGTVYKQKISSQLQELLSQETGLQIPLRVAPGGLSVSRTFGDIGAKLPSLNGNPDVVIAIPEIKRVDIDNSMDFIFLACDGVYDTLSNQDVHNTIWKTARREYRRGKSIHEVCGTCTQQVLLQALVHNSLDNVTGILPK